MSDEDDPFEAFDDIGEDREGDPFDRLDEEDDDYDAHDVTPAGHRDELDEDESTDEPPAEGDPFADSDFEIRDEPGVRRDEEGASPFDEGGEQQGDPFGEDGVFEEMDVGELDPDDVWTELTDAQARGSVSELKERIYAEVSKHRYCEQCEFFSAPPDVHCSHEGTEILEFTDMEQVRVVDCPIVAERKQLEEE